MKMNEIISNKDIKKKYAFIRKGVEVYRDRFDEILVHLKTMIDNNEVNELFNSRTDIDNDGLLIQTENTKICHTNIGSALEYICNYITNGEYPTLYKYAFGIKCTYDRAKGLQTIYVNKLH